MINDTPFLENDGKLNKLNEVFGLLKINVGKEDRSIYRCVCGAARSVYETNNADIKSMK